jgi:hypothetical protein
MCLPSRATRKPALPSALTARWCGMPGRLGTLDGDLDLSDLGAGGE